MRRLATLLLLSLPLFAQNAALQTDPNPPFLDNNGKPVAGGKLYTCSAGTTCPGNPLATYTDITAGTPNANPVILDSTGRAPVYIGTSSYKFVLQNSLGVQIWVRDNISSTAIATAAATTAAFGSSTGSTLVKYTASGTGAVTRTVASKLGDTLNARDYGATGNGSTDDTTAITRSIAAIPAAGGYVRVPAGTYLVSSPITLGGLSAKSGLLCDEGVVFTFTSTSLNLFNVGALGRLSGCTVTVPASYAGTVVTVNSGNLSNLGNMGMEIDHVRINATTDSLGTGFAVSSSSSSQAISFLSIHDIYIGHIGTMLALTATGSGSYVNGNYFANWITVGGTIAVDFNAGSGGTTPIIQGNAFDNWVIENPATAGWQYDGAGNIWQNVSTNTMMFDVNTPDKSVNTTGVSQNLLQGFIFNTGTWTPNAKNTYITNNQSLLPYVVGNTMSSFGQSALKNARGGIGIGNVANSTLNTFPYPADGINYDPSIGMTLWGLSAQGGSFALWHLYDATANADVATISQVNGSYNAPNGTGTFNIGAFGTSYSVGGTSVVSSIRYVTTFSLTPSAVTAQTCSDQTFTGGQIANLTTSDRLGSIVAPSALGNVSVSGDVSASATLRLHFCNPSVASVTPPAGSYSFLAMH